MKAPHCTQLIPALHPAYPSVSALRVPWCRLLGSAVEVGAMSEFHHPMRDAELHTFERGYDSGKGAIWVARFYPYGTYPVFFHGETEAEAIANAEALRAEAIEKHEASVIARKEAQKKAAETRAKKKAATL